MNISRYSFDIKRINYRVAVHSLSERAVFVRVNDSKFKMSKVVGFSSVHLPFFDKNCKETSQRKYT